MERCDNLSVGVVLHNEQGELALLTRRKFPIGIAPPAGHIDDHGSAEQAACDEVGEEIGVALALSSLHRTVIHERMVRNRCRRPGGNYHIWTVYEATVHDTALMPDADETRGAEWYDRSAVQQLAERTKQYRHGLISEDEWTMTPGLEPVWAEFLAELGHFDNKE